MICRGVCACTEMLWICVLYVSFGSMVRPTTCGCVAMGIALLFIGYAKFKLTLFGCVISICCVGVVSLDVVYDELNDCAWNTFSLVYPVTVVCGTF